MPAFAIASQNQRKQSQTQNSSDFNAELSILVSAKKAKLSFEELNLMTLQDFFDYIDMFVGENEDNSYSEPRMATQTDIDSFYRM